MQETKLLTRFNRYLDEDTNNFKIAGFLGNVSNFRRFIARKKFADNFKEIKVDKLGANTVDGYFELIRLSMVYSAFENYVILLHGDKKNYYDNASKLLTNEKSEEILKEISDIDYDMEIWKFIKQELTNDKIEINIHNYLNGNTTNIIYLAAGIRHIFVHGLLTPNVKKDSPEDVAIIAGKISKFLLECLSENLKSKMQNFLNKNEGNN